MLKLMDNTSASKKRKMMKKSEEHTSCLCCQENYSTSVESWVSCSDCLRWAHYSCAGLEEKDKDHVLSVNYA